LHSGISKHGKKNIFGSLFGLIIAGGVLSLIFFFFQSLIVNFEETSNEWELLMFTLFLLFALQVVWSMVLSVKLFFDSNNNMLLAKYPIPPRTLFLSKLTYGFSREVVFGLALFMPLLNVYGVMLNFGTSFFVMIPIVAFLSSMLAFFIGTALSFAFVYIKTYLSNKFWLMLILFIGIIAGGFYGYMELVNGVIDVTNNLSFHISSTLIDVIADWAVAFYFSELFGNMLFYQNLVVNLLIFLGITAGAFGVLFALQHFAYGKMIERGVGGEKTYVSRFGKNRRKFGFWALLVREFKIIFRDIGFLFQYYAFVVITPLMVYLCMAGSVDISFELIGSLGQSAIGVFVLFLFVVFTTSFASTSISREGEAFYILKTYPLSPIKYIWSKVVFALLAVFVAIAATTGVLIGFEILDWPSALMLGSAALLFSLSQICLAIQIDLKGANLSKDGMVENDSNFSITVALGFLGAFLIGAIAAIIAFATASEELAMLFTLDEALVYYVVLAISGLLAIGGMLMLFIRARTKYIAVGR